MTDRLRKKRFKKRWGIKKVPRTMNIKKAEKVLRYYQAELTRRLATALDNAVFYGRIKHERCT